MAAKKRSPTGADFPRPMGVPCVDPLPTSTKGTSSWAYGQLQQLEAERRKPTPTLRYYAAQGLLTIARTLRHLAYRIAS